MRLNKISAFLFALLISVSAAAQTAVSLAPVTHTRYVDYNTVISIEKHISEILSKMTAVELRSNSSVWSNIKRERESQMTVDFMLSETVEQGKSLAAQKIVYGHVIETHLEEDENGKKITINMDMGIADVESAKIDGSKQFIFSGASDATKANIVGDMTGKPKTGGLIGAYGTISGNAELTSHLAGALKELDEDLIPFLLTHLGGEMEEEEKANSKKEINIPNIKFNLPKSTKKDNHFSIADLESETTITIVGTKADKIKKGSKFVLVKEYLKSGTDFNGKPYSKTMRDEMANFNFKEYKGELTLLEIDKKSEKSINDILEDRKEGDMFYIMFKQ